MRAASSRSLRWSQHRALTAAFLARFFESEATANATDMRQSFFWLVALLATPGIFLPIYMALHWANYAADAGVPALRLAALLDKTIYLNLTFVSMSIVSAMIWHALVVDRRDGLVLSGLPVRVRTIYSSKLLALALYVALLSVGMHLPAALLYGGGLGSPESWTAVARNAAGLVVAGSAVNMFVAAAVAGAQSACLAVAGPVRFGRVSPFLQVLMVAAATMLLLLLPIAAVGSLTLSAWPAGDGRLLWLPPMWFLGLYELVVGTTLPVMPVLAGRALAAMLIAVSVLLISYPLASHRALTAAVEGGTGRRNDVLRRATRQLTLWLTRDPHERAIVQFMLTAIGRTHQNRLILSVSAGVGLAMVMPIAVSTLARLRALPTHAELPLLAAPLLLAFALAVGLRLAAAIPSELAASWIFPVAPSPMLAGRNAARRTMLALAVLMPLVIVAPIWLWLWGPRAAAIHLLACALGGAVLVDTCYWGFVGIPCAKPMAPDRANLQFRWPFMAIGFFVFVFEFPRWQILSMRGPGAVVLIGLLAALWWTVRRMSANAAYVNGVSGDPHAVLSLNLGIITAGDRGPIKERHA